MKHLNVMILASAVSCTAAAGPFTDTYVTQQLRTRMIANEQPVVDSVRAVMAKEGLAFTANQEVQIRHIVGDQPFVAFAACMRHADDIVARDDASQLHNLQQALKYMRRHSIRGKSYSLIIGSGHAYTMVVDNSDAIANYQKQIADIKKQNASATYSPVGNHLRIRVSVRKAHELAQVMRCTETIPKDVGQQTELTVQEMIEEGKEQVRTDAIEEPTPGHKALVIILGVIRAAVAL